MSAKNVYFVFHHQNAGSNFFNYLCINDGRSLFTQVECFNLIIICLSDPGWRFGLIVISNRAVWLLCYRLISVLYFCLAIKRYTAITRFKPQGGKRAFFPSSLQQRVYLYLEQLF